MSSERCWERTPSATVLVVAASLLLLVCLAVRPAVAATYSHMLYDDTFQNMWTDGSWKAEVDPEHDTRVYNGQSSIEVTLKGRGAFCFEFKNGRNLSRHAALVGWVNGGSEGGQDLRVFMVDAEGKVLPDGKSLRLNYRGYINGGKIVPQRWQFFVIPVSHFKLGPRDITRIAFYNPSEETMPTFYLDDVGFTTERLSLASEEEGTTTTTTTPGPVPQTPRTAHIVYGDRLQNGWEDWSWGGSKAELLSRTKPAEGQTCIAVSQPAGGALAFGRHGKVDTTGYKAFAFYVNGGSEGGQQLGVSVFDEDGKELGAVSVNKADYTEAGRIPAGRWQRVYVPLRDLHAGESAISKIAITNSGRSSTMYSIDAVSLVK
ncbi:MAG: hypothetical protein JW889_11520 [Verrucomicrobia bacterium]|nr:hypothetical protein [Verrucomicrobiota bacterium]